MVNEISDSKSNILAFLYQQSPGTVSGDAVGDRLGISRVAVWKHVKSLIEAGYDIVSSPKGYALSRPEDTLLPCSFPEPFQRLVYYLPTVDSTMDAARRMARKKKIPHMGLVVADQQTRGRGRLNREWISQKGGLWFTLVLFPETPPATSHIYNFTASVCLAETVNRLYRIDARVKWPNDLLVGNCKLCGLLSEMETRSDMIRFLTIGIGINVNNRPKSHEPAAISIREILRKEVCRRDILTEFHHAFGRRIRHLDAAGIMHRYRQTTSTIGRDVRIQTFDRTIEGRAVDIDDSGALLVRTGTDMIEKIIYGDCFYQNSGPRGT